MFSQKKFLQLSRDLLRFQIFCWGEKKLGPNWHESFVSAPTYFENIHGFQHAPQKTTTRQATLSLDKSIISSPFTPAFSASSANVNRQSRFSFLSTGHSSSNIMTFSRGFKTKRSNAGTLPFTR